jgi:hypothetical protein
VLRLMVRCHSAPAPLAVRRHPLSNDTSTSAEGRILWDQAISLERHSIALRPPWAMLAQRKNDGVDHVRQ